MLNEATTAATNTINAVVNYFTQLPGQIMTYLSQCVSTMTTWGSNMLSEATTGMQSVFNGIVDTFTSLPSRMAEIGTNIVAGIKQGISDAWSSMTGWLGGLCDSFITGVNKKFDIHSPSRVMRQIGQYVGDGFALGIGDTVNSISKQANAIADAAMPNVNAGSYDMGVNYSPIGGNNVSSTGSNMDMLLAKMDEMTKAISNMQVLIDGRPAGKILTPYISNNLAFNNNRKGW
jgi:phage-related protein